MPYCTNCGAQNPPDSKFCRECGKPLDTSAQPPTQSQGVAQPPTQPQSVAQHPRQGTAETCILAATIFYGVAAILILFTGSAIGLMGVILPAGVALCFTSAPTKMSNGATTRRPKMRPWRWVSLVPYLP